MANLLQDNGPARRVTVQIIHVTTFGIEADIASINKNLTKKIFSTVALVQSLALATLLVFFSNDGQMVAKILVAAVLTLLLCFLARLILQCILV